MDGPTASRDPGQPYARHLVTQLATVLQDALAPGTKRTYRNAWDRFKIFWGRVYPDTFGPSLPISNTDLAVFIVHLRNEGLIPSSITSIVSAISYPHKMMGFPDPSGSFLVHKTLVSMQKTTPHTDSRLPITLPLLIKMLRACDHVVTVAYNRILLKSVMATAFFGLFREWVS